MMRFWTFLRGLGRGGDLLILAVLVLYAPTIVTWMLVVDGACGARDALGTRAGRLRSGRMPSRAALVACIGAIIGICVPVLLLNTALLVGALGWFS
jgi:hypothetical protein